MGYQSESALENKLIEQLVSKGYQWVPEVKSEATMIANFRTILETRNSANIGDDPLTDKELDRLMTQINGKSIFERQFAANSGKRALSAVGVQNPGKIVTLNKTGLKNVYDVSLRNVIQGKFLCVT